MSSHLFLASSLPQASVACFKWDRGDIRSCDVPHLVFLSGGSATSSAIGKGIEPQNAATKAQSKGNKSMVAVLKLSVVCSVSMFLMVDVGIRCELLYERG